MSVIAQNITHGQRTSVTDDSLEICNALTVDVEDYYHVSGFEQQVERSQWDQHESRVVASTRRLLALFREHDVRGTFFVLGWVAERFPELVREIAERGHEVASHSYWHRMVHSLDPAAFREDVRRSKEVLESITGRPITAFRAPSFSITRRSMWALEILADEGFNFDSSIFPVRHDRYGVPGAETRPHVQQTSCGDLLEFPPSVLPIGRYRLPVAGGGYFRAFPRKLTLHAIRRCNRRGLPFMFYIHPWELDPGQPRVAGVRWKSRARHYVNLRRTETKLRWILQRARFGSIGQVLSQPRWIAGDKLPALPDRDGRSRLEGDAGLRQECLASN